MDQSAIVLLSGGQDSTTCLYWARQVFEGDVHALIFDYKQKHRVEVQCAVRIAEEARVPYIVKNVAGIFAPSALTSHGDTNTRHHRDPLLPSTFTPGRNALFFTVAASWGYELGIKNIVSGVCQTDYSGYPDCRREFVDAMEVALQAALGVPVVDIHTPLMYKTKAETWKMAAELDILDIVIHKTHTDYNGSRQFNEWGYGTLDNPASQLRAKGFYEAREKGWI